MASDIIMTRDMGSQKSVWLAVIEGALIADDTNKPLMIPETLLMRLIKNYLTVQIQLAQNRCYKAIVILYIPNLHVSKNSLLVST